MGHTILLADDSITIQKVIELTFSDEDFTLHTVGNGQKAIEEIRSVRPDIVLCDIIMPEKNGYEVCEFIKSSDDLKHIPVLLLTGAFEPFDQERARKAGCDGFLAKPFEPQTLISKVKELLASAGAPAAGPVPVVEETPQMAAPTPPPAAPAPEPTPSPVAEPPPTVEMSMGPGPQGPAPPPMEEEGATVMADDFAVEAGQRELSVEPEDQTVLLGEDETPTVPSEDIWKEVQKAQDVPGVPPQPEAPVDEGATVFVPPQAEMPAEPTAAPPEQEVGGGGFDDFASPGEPAATPESDAWVLSSDEPPPPQPAEPELTPLGDFGGFDDFSAAESPKPGEAEPVAPEAPPFTPEPQPPAQEASPPEFVVPEAPPAPAAPAGPEPPISELPLSAEPEVSPETPAPATPEPVPLEEPQPIVEPAPPTEPPPVDEPTPVFEPVVEIPPAPVRPPVSEEPVSAAPPTSEPPAEAPPRAAEPSPPPAVSEPAEPTPLAFEEPIALPQDVDALVDKIAERVVAKLSEKVVKEVAWEVVPDLAETLIRKEIDALKAKIPK